LVPAEFLTGSEQNPGNRGKPRGFWVSAFGGLTTP
jgi:hypothetical protein